MGCDLNGSFYLMSSSCSAELENTKQNPSTDKATHSFPPRQQDKVL